MQQDLIEPNTASNISYIMDLAFGILGIVLVLTMIFTLVKVLKRIKELINNQY